MGSTLTLLVVVILALAFDYINGFHDTANPVATVVSTNVLPGRTAVLLAAGTPGKRLAVPNARILIHQPATEGIYGQVSDLEIQAAEISRMRKLLEATLAKHSGKTPEQVRLDIERDKILTSEEAKEYGIIDEIIQSRKLTPVS